MGSPNYIECPGCKKFIAETTNGKYRKHKNDHTDEPCDYGGTVIPEEAGCQNPSEESSATSAPAASSVTSSPDGAKDPAPPATSSTASSLNSPARAAGASTASAPSAPELPGAAEYVAELGATVTEQTDAYRAEVEAKLTPFSQPAPHYEVDQPALFSQPAGRKSEAPAQPMNDLGKEMTARLKEMFYAYDNRRSSDNRSAQATMGPSEMGTPCDRRLALSLMRMPPVNPGGDGWAAFVGTCIHAGLEQMFMWADAGTGRFAVEQRLEFPSKIVPKGTADLIDRTLFMLDDHKCQGRWSRNKLKSSGPSRTYRVQAHVYAKGARLRGERIDHVAIISWPRDEATLDDLYVWTEPYNPAIADGAFERVDNINAEVSAKQAELYNIYAAEHDGPEPEVDLQIKARVAADFDVADDCRYCPFYLPNARDITRGCNGKR
jgi:hypothetical protein